MQSVSFLAQLIGPCLLVVSVAMLARREAMIPLVENLGSICVNYGYTLAPMAAPSQSCGVASSPGASSLRRQPR